MTNYRYLLDQLVRAVRSYLETQDRNKIPQHLINALEMSEHFLHGNERSMIEVVINRKYGGYGLSEEAYKELSLEWDGYGYAFDQDRANPELVRVVKQLGAKANGRFASLAIVEVPTGVSWSIDEYDGYESISQKLEIH